jgi:hypothetical protein
MKEFVKKNNSKIHSAITFSFMFSLLLAVFGPTDFMKISGLVVLVLSSLALTIYLVFSPLIMFGISKKHEFVVVGHFFPYPNDAPEIKVANLKCIHCEETTTINKELIKVTPFELAKCPYGVKPPLKEKFSGFYNCFLEEDNGTQEKTPLEGKEKTDSEGESEGERYEEGEGEGDN